MPKTITTVRTTSVKTTTSTATPPRTPMSDATTYMQKANGYRLAAFNATAREKK